MTLQQLRYLIAIAEYGSINAAAHNLYASQSNLSTAIKDLEHEFAISIFRRSNRGVTLTNEGAELLAYARQVVEQADMLESRYAHTREAHARLAVSTQHYAFSVQAFIATAEACANDQYDFILRETATSQIIQDVKTFRSDLGILFLDDFNSRVMWKAFDEAGLMFYPLFEANAHVFIGVNHPLAGKDVITLDDLEPYPRYSFEQGVENSFYFAEEPFGHLSHKKNFRISDRGTLTNLLADFNGYTISTGILSNEMYAGIVSKPLAVKETMRVGYAMNKDRRPSDLLASYIENLKKIARESDQVESYLGD